MKPVRLSSITSGTEPRLNAITGVPQAMLSIITRPNGSGQSIGNSSACAPDRNAGFWLSLISPMNSTHGLASISGLIGSHSIPVGVIDLGGDHQLHAGGAGDADRLIHAFFR